MDLYAATFYVIDLGLNYFSGETKLGNGQSQHTASNRLGLKDGCLVTQFGQEIAQVRPVGPAPTTAIFGTLVTGKGLLLLPIWLKYQSDAKRLRALIATGSSSSPRRHFNSQGCIHMRPQTAGNGFLSLMISTACSYFPLAMEAT